MDTEAEPSVFRPARALSLQELATSASITELLHLSFKDSEFSALEPRLQELLFGKLRKEILRLQEEERNGAILKRRMPHADLELYTSKPRLVRFKEGDEDSFAVERDPEPYTLQTYHREKWSYTKETYFDFSPVRINGGRDKSILVWESMHLYWDLPLGDLKLNKRPFEHEGAPDYWPGQGKSFTDRISSQLMLYRIIVMFGMIPPEIEGYEDRYKSCWECMLVHADGQSRLSLYDYKGWASLKFKGSEAASKDAMDLLNFLCGRGVPHSYDGVLAGLPA